MEILKDTENNFFQQTLFEVIWPLAPLAYIE